MPRRISLNQFEKGQILAFRTSGKSMNYIAKELNRSRCVLQNFLRDQILYCENKRNDGPRLLTNRQEGQTIKYLPNSTLSCKQIKENCNLSASPFTIFGL